MRDLNERRPSSITSRLKRLKRSTPSSASSALDGVADHVAARQTRALVEQVVGGGAGALAAALEVPARELVALADLHAGQVDAVLVAHRRTHGHAAGRARADVQHVRDAARPREQLALPEDRHERLHVGVVDVADRGVVVGEDVAGPDPRVLLVAVADHPLDRIGHRVDVDDDPRRERDRVALGRVQREAQLAELAHDRRGGDVQRGRARRHEPAAQPREQLLVADRVRAHQLELAQARVAAGLREQALGLLEHLGQACAPPSRCPARWLARACCRSSPWLDLLAGRQVEDVMPVQARDASRRDRERRRRVLDDRRARDRVAGLDLLELEDVGVDEARRRWRAPSAPGASSFSGGVPSRSRASRQRGLLDVDRAVDDRVGDEVAELR